MGTGIFTLEWISSHLTWHKNVHLQEVLPQSRNRLLMVANRIDDPRVSNVMCRTWEEVDGPPTLAQPPEDHMHSLTPNIPSWLLEQYFQRRYLPKGTGLTDHEVRRCRIKTSRDVHPCVMANYVRSHDLPDRTLLDGGLIGSFILSAGVLRRLSIPELLMLFGCCHSCYLPADAHITYRLLGNAIAIPHALLCLTNGLAQRVTVTWNQIPLWILQDALQERLFNHNVQASLVMADTHVLIERLQVSSTAPWGPTEYPLGTLHIPQHQEHLTFRVQEGVPLLDLLRFLFDIRSNANAGWKPRGDAQVEIPLFAEDQTPLVGMTLNDVWLGPLILDENKFQNTKQQTITTVTPLGLFVFDRSSIDSVESLVNASGNHMHGQLRPHNHVGQVIEPDAPPPDMLFVDAHQDQPLPDLQLIYEVQWLPTNEGLHVSLRMSKALQLLHLYSQMGLNDDIKSMGWKVVLDLNSGVDSTDPHQASLAMRRCPTAVSTTVQDLVSLLSTKVMHTKLEQQYGSNKSGLWIKVKLWQSFVWSGFAEQSCKGTRMGGRQPSLWMS